MANGGTATICGNLLMWVRDKSAGKGKRFEIDECQTELGPVLVECNPEYCGLFLCKLADFLCRGWENFTFSRTHMSYFRSRFADDLLMGLATWVAVARFTTFEHLLYDERKSLWRRNEIQ